MTDVEQIIDDSGQTIPEIMGEMMEKGYVVTGVQNAVSLMKVATDSDPKVTINIGADNPSVLPGFQTKLHAIARYLQIRNEKEPQVVKSVWWVGTVRYEIGRNIKFHEITEIFCPTYEEAMITAKIVIDRFVEANPDVMPFGYKEVRVRPVGA